MKIMRVLFAVAISTVVVFPPALAQRPAGSDARSKVENMLQGYHEAVAKEDAAAASKFFTSDAIYVAATGKVFAGQQQIEEAYAGFYKQIGPLKSVIITTDQANGLSDGSVWALGHATFNTEKGVTINVHWTALDVPVGDTLKIKMLSIGAEPQPQQPQTAGAPSTR